jgi:hypothetical protein
MIRRARHRPCLTHLRRDPSESSRRQGGAPYGKNDLDGVRWRVQWRKREARRGVTHRRTNSVFLLGWVGGEKNMNKRPRSKLRGIGLLKNAASCGEWTRRDSRRREAAQRLPRGGGGIQKKKRERGQKPSFSCSSRFS